MTEFQYVDGVADRTRIDPDTWRHDITQMARPGNNEIQLDLFQDYGTNVPLYPKFQEFFRAYQPPTLIVWGKDDYIFPEDGAHPYLEDLPQAELHVLDTGHFLLEDKLDVAAPLIRDFLDRTLRQPLRIAQPSVAKTRSRAIGRWCVLPHHGFPWIGHRATDTPGN